MSIRRIEIRLLELPMIESLDAAHGAISIRRTIVVRMSGSHGFGLGECIAMETGYRGQYLRDEFEFICNELGPALLESSNAYSQAIDMQQHSASVSAFADALVDAEHETSLVDRFTIERSSIAAIGVVGLFDGDRLLSSIERLIRLGYRQLKMKVIPGSDVARLALVQSAYPGMITRIDANGSYDLDDPDHRRALDQLDLLGLDVIEQPVAKGSESKTRSMQTIVAWDESASSSHAIASLVRDGATAVVLKPGFLGGIEESLRIAHRCTEGGVEVFVGGAVESPIGRRSTMILAACTSDEHAEVAPVQRWFSQSLGSEPETLIDGRLHLGLVDNFDWDRTGAYAIEAVTLGV